MWKAPCFECGQESQHDHHIIPVSLGGTKTVRLCESCHGKIHGLDFTNHGVLISIAMKKIMDEGKTTGVPKIGMRSLDDGYLVEDPHETLCIERILQYRKEGISIRKIADLMNKGDLHSRTNRWHKTTIERILKEHR